jgi:hypothetical protein
MSHRVITPGFLGPVIQIDGECYEFLGFTEEAIEVSPEDPPVFETCAECEASSTTPSSAAPSSAAPSSAAPSSAASSGGLAALAECDCAGTNANPPRMVVTLTWSGGPATRDWLNCTFSNGVPQIVCTEESRYNKNCNTGSATFTEGWNKTLTPTASNYLRMNAYKLTAFTSDRLFVRYNGEYLSASNSSGVTNKLANFSTDNIVPANFGQSGILNHTAVTATRGYADGGFFGEVTASNGVSVKWQKGPSGDVDHWGCP